MKEINQAFKAFMLKHIDEADLRALIRKRVNELKKCIKDCPLQENLKNLK